MDSDFFYSSIFHLQGNTSAVNTMAKAYIYTVLVGVGSRVEMLAGNNTVIFYRSSDWPGLYLSLFPWSNGVA